MRSNKEAVQDLEHPLDPLTAEEIRSASCAIKCHLKSKQDGSLPFDVDKELRFVAVSLLEPPKSELLEYLAAIGAGKENGAIIKPKRMAESVTINPMTGIASEFKVDLESATVTFQKDLPSGAQPLFSPEDCDLAEAVVQSCPNVAKVMKERYGIKDMLRVACDPWSVHFASDEDAKLARWREDNDTNTDGNSYVPGRLIQTFLYERRYGDAMEDNHYAHPIDILPVVDLNAKKVVAIHGLERPPPKIPTKSVNYHRDLVKTNSYLESSWRDERLAALDIVQPEGPSFTVTGNRVDWQKWSFRVGFNYREGLVLHNVCFDGRLVMHRASLVEMAVPYADPHPPYQRKCAFDVGDYGLGFCANSLDLGCDCLGHIQYFDAVLNDCKGEPVEKKKVVCMHEEDNGVLWKHVEYRNGHNEARRGRELIISSIATVVNYEYLFYWHLRQDGCIDFKIKLSGELSTNLLSEAEDKNDQTPTHGVMVAPGVNAQIHQHMFCARIDMAVDSHKNTVSEVDIVREAPGPTNPYGNSFSPIETVFNTEKGAVRSYDAAKARAWKISNAEGKINPMTGKPVAYKLYPFTQGAAQPTLLTSPDCAVSKKGEFATANLWVSSFLSFFTTFCCEILLDFSLIFSQTLGMI